MTHQKHIFLFTHLTSFDKGEALQMVRTCLACFLSFRHPPMMTSYSYSEDREWDRGRGREEGSEREREVVRCTTCAGVVVLWPWCQVWDVLNVWKARHSNISLIENFETSYSADCKLLLACLVAYKSCGLYICSSPGKVCRLLTASDSFRHGRKLDGQQLSIASSAQNLAPMLAINWPSGRHV